MHMCVSTTSDKKLQLLNKSIPTESRQQMSTYFYLKQWLCLGRSCDWDATKGQAEKLKFHQFSQDVSTAFVGNCQQLNQLCSKKFKALTLGIRLIYFLKFPPFTSLRLSLILASASLIGSVTDKELKLHAFGKSYLTPGILFCHGTSASIQDFTRRLGGKIDYLNWVWYLLDKEP